MLQLTIVFILFGLLSNLIFNALVNALPNKFLTNKATTWDGSLAVEREMPSTEQQLFGGLTTQLSIHPLYCAFRQQREIKAHCFQDPPNYLLNSVLSLHTTFYNWCLVSRSSNHMWCILLHCRNGGVFTSNGTK